MFLFSRTSKILKTPMDVLSHLHDLRINRLTAGPDYIRFFHFVLPH